MNRSKQLGEENIGKLLFQFSIPAIVGMMVNALYNVVDRIFIGKGVGSLGIAGIFVGYPISLILMAFSMLIGIGGNSLVSIKLGEKKEEEAQKILGNAFILLILISASISVIGLIFLEPLLKAFGASKNILPYSIDYMTIILIGAPMQALGFGLNNFIRGEGNPKVAMGTMLIGAILNTILDPIFIFVFKMGMKGAAYATIISQGVSAIWVLSYFMGNKSLLKLKRENIKLQGKIVKNIISIGLAPFSMQIAASAVTILLNKSLQKYGGDVATSSMAAINSITMMILMPIFGINQGAQPIIGFNYGAKKYNRVKETLKLAIIFATIISSTGFIITQTIPEKLIGLFGKNEKELIEVGSKALRIYLSMLPIIGVQVISSNYFQATGKPKQAMILSLSRQVLVLIPALVILPRLFQLNGVWLAGPISDLVSSIITAIVLIKDLKHLEEQSIAYTPRTEEK
ncbi:MATE family efflux transporter [Sporanaerobacter acetigenes]|uniref:Multidrug export protein MepA n=1 Tax=Sporanaerobacter acetigenes DSM 13106 TaxID=1123281 RepID=A0A1M5Y4S1_9FIRM|nr:MATE family efflux transporter [Sporanaerobacter acetigenes]SHI06976.1 putative efflux protein, MATE family [Sporanaerobacter acetigenes DSM 13106]